MQMDVIKISLLALLGLFISCGSAEASRCQGPTVNAGFGNSFYGTTIVSGFMYDTDYDKLYVNFPNITYATYMNVPLSVAYQFAPSKTPDDFYEQQIVPVYEASLETNICLQLVTEDGTYIVVN